MTITDYGVKGILYKALAATPQSDRLAGLAMRVESDLPAGSTEKLDFIGMVPALREWVGQRLASKPLEYKPTVTLKKFEATAVVPLDWVNNDKTGQVSQVAGQLAARYNPQWPGARVARLINASETETTGIDGKAFFASDHVMGDSGTIDNLLDATAATGTTPTPLEAANAIVAAHSAMIAFKDDRGEPINENLTSLAVVVKAGGALAASLMLAVKQDALDTGTGVLPNPVKALGIAIEVIASPRITLDDRFALINTSPGACPFVFMENKADHKVTMKGAGSDFEHDNDAWEMGIKAVGEAAFGRFTDAVLTVFT